MPGIVRRSRKQVNTGQARPTIYDVARVAGVSTFTVSAVLNGTAYVSAELTQRVRRAADQLDYTINELARSVQKGQTRTVGMLIPNIANDFYAHVVRGAEDVLRKVGYCLILSNTYNDPEEQHRSIETFRARRVDGFLLFAAFGDQAAIRKLVEKGVPLCFVARGPIGYLADVVASDNLLGTRDAVEHLIVKGHRRIAILTGPQSLTTTTARIAGWRQALSQAGLAAPDPYIAISDFTIEAGSRLAHQLLSLKEPPTALFVTNLATTTGVLRARLPVEVFASDDADWLDVVTPPVHSLDLRSYEIGAKAAELVLARASAPERPYQEILIPPVLKIRNQP